MRSFCDGTHWKVRLEMKGFGPCPWFLYVECFRELVVYYELPPAFVLWVEI